MEWQERKTSSRAVGVNGEGKNTAQGIGRNARGGVETAEVEKELG